MPSVKVVTTCISKGWSETCSLHVINIWLLIHNKLVYSRLAILLWSYYGRLQRNLTKMPIWQSVSTFFLAEVEQHHDRQSPAKCKLKLNLLSIHSFWPRNLAGVLDYISEYWSLYCMTSSSLAGLQNHKGPVSKKNKKKKKKHEPSHYAKERQTSKLHKLLAALELIYCFSWSAWKWFPILMWSLVLTFCSVYIQT